MKRSNFIGTIFCCPFCQKTLTLNPEKIFTTNRRYTFTCPYCNKSVSIKRHGATAYEVIEPIEGVQFKTVLIMQAS